LLYEQIRQIRDLLLGDLTASIFVFGVIVLYLYYITNFVYKEKINYEKDYYDRHGSLPK